MQSEIRLAEKKVHLEQFQPQFVDIKKKFEESCKTLEQDIKDIDELIKERDAAYTTFIKVSSNKYQHILQESQQVEQSSGFFGSLGKMLGKK